MLRAAQSRVEAMNATEAEEWAAWHDLARRSAGDDKGAAWLAKALGHHGTLTRLRLGGFLTSVGDGGAKWLAEALARNNTLTELYLGGNLIGDEGAKQLAEALEQNTTLTKLDLGGNLIGDEGAKRLLKALDKNESLTELSLPYYKGGNSIAGEYTKRLDEALNRNKTLTMLRKVGKLIHSEDTKQQLAEEHERHDPLTSLNLSCNSIGAEGAKLLAEALEHNKAHGMLDIQLKILGKRKQH